MLVPFTNMVIFGTIFGRVASLPSDGLNPYIFYLAGLTPWQYFANTLNFGSNSLVGFSHLLTKIYLPRVFIPLGSCLANLLDLAISFAMLLLVALCLGLVPAWTLIFIPLLLVIEFITAFGVTLFFSALNVKYRDVKFIVPFLTQVWMYCTLLIPFSRFPERWGLWRYLYGLNPMAGVIEGIRWMLLHPYMQSRTVTETILAGQQIPERLEAGQTVIIRTLEDQSVQIVLQQTILGPVDAPWGLIAVGVPSACLIFVIGWMVFRRMEKTFADLV